MRKIHFVEQSPSKEQKKLARLLGETLITKARALDIANFCEKRNPPGISDRVGRRVERQLLGFGPGAEGLLEIYDTVRLTLFPLSSIGDLFKAMYGSSVLAGLIPQQAKIKDVLPSVWNPEATTGPVGYDQHGGSGKNKKKKKKRKK